MKNIHVNIVVRDVLFDTEELPFNSQVSPAAKGDSDSANNSIGTLDISVFYEQAEKDKEGYYALSFDDKSGCSVECFDAIGRNNLSAIANFLEVACIAGKAGVHSADLEQNINDGWFKVGCVERGGTTFVMMTVTICVSSWRDKKKVYAPLTVYLTINQANLLSAACRTVSEFVFEKESEAT